MKNILTLVLALISLTSFSQTEVKKKIKKEVKIENADGKYKVTMETTENGETKTITRTYDSLEEMKNDPEMGDVKIMTPGGKGKNIVILNDVETDGEHKKEIKVIVKSTNEGEADADVDIDVDSNHTFIFKSDDVEEAEMHKIKVWVDEDGKKHISKDGVEIDPDSQEVNTWTGEDGKTYEIKKSGGKIMFMSENETGEIITEDGKRVNVKVKIDGNSGDEEQEMIFIETISEDENTDAGTAYKYVVKIVDELKVHLEEIDENEFSDIQGIDAKDLKLNDLSYYPNPNSGKFTLAFEAANKPTEIKITSVSGKEVYSEKLQSFEGTYSNEIDLSGQDPGIYLLQVLQGKKAMNKKIVIE